MILTVIEFPVDSVPSDASWLGLRFDWPGKLNLTTC